MNLKNHVEKQHRRTVKGFTLTELIVVIAIIGILAAVLMPTMTTWWWKSRVRSANATAKMTYNSAQTEIQKYLSIDRTRTTNSDFSGLVCISYDRSSGAIRIGKNTASAGSDPVISWVAITDTSVTDAERTDITNVVRNVNRTVSNATDYNWAVYVENYIVKSSVAAESTGTDCIGYYTKGSITNERASGSYSTEMSKILVDKGKAY